MVETESFDADAAGSCANETEEIISVKIATKAKILMTRNVVMAFPPQSVRHEVNIVDSQW